MNLQKSFEKTLAHKKYIFLPYLAAGEPSWQKSFEIADLYLSNGADGVELGLPFSDPTADGPILQAVFEKILQRGFEFDKYLELCWLLHKKHPTKPIISMGYSNVFLQLGLTKGLQKLIKVGVNGLIIPDLPLEERDKFYGSLDKKLLANISFINFVTPTTSDERLKRIASKSSGFIYIVSTKGVTGKNSSNPSSLKPMINKIRKLTSVPLLIGFGISDHERAMTASQISDGFICGSKLHSIITKSSGSALTKALKNQMKQFDLRL